MEFIHAKSTAVKIMTSWTIIKYQAATDGKEEFQLC